MNARRLVTLCVVAGALSCLLVVTCAGQQPLKSAAHEPPVLMLWSEPPVIGMYSIDSARVDDSLPIIATADWPRYTDSLARDLHHCTRLSVDLGGWSLRTVAAQAFYVRVWDRPTQSWKQDEPFVGFTFPTVSRIYVIQSGLFSKNLLRHEMLHALLASHGFDPRHNTPVADGMFKRCFPEDQ